MPPRVLPMNLLFAVLSCVLLASDDFCFAYLDRLLIAYREYGLPLPPPEAKLMRYECKPRLNAIPLGGAGWRGDKQQLLPGRTGTAFLIDGTITNRWGEIETVASVTPVKPDLTSISEKDLDWSHFAIQLYDRGWKQLALASFRKSTRLCGWETDVSLAYDAFWYWRERIHNDPKVPLANIAKYLKRAVSRNRHDVEFGREILQSLELTMTPSKALPGSDEALIDDIVNVCDVMRFAGAWDWGLRSDPRYRAIVRRGLHDRAFASRTSR